MIAIRLEYEVKRSWIQSCLTKNLPQFRSKMTNTLIATPECWQHIWMQLKYLQNHQLNAIAIMIVICLEYKVKRSWLQSCLTKNLPRFRSKMTNTLIATPECWQHIWMQLKYQQNRQLNAIAITIAIRLEYEVKWSWLQSCLTKNLPWFRSKMTNTLIATPECWQHIWMQLKYQQNHQLNVIAIMIAIRLEYKVKWSWLQSCLTKNLPWFRSQMTNTLITTHLLSYWSSICK